ncbi:MAG: hypothetical protein KA314_24445 [Chloroflexi bacterium]|nr:hypothetical protein [Chloroflexota bacterium]MBP8058996.1 hypothetical protein [Chloroflexota bacterium]
MAQAINWRYLLRVGLLAGVILLYVSAIGLIETFSVRSLIADVLTLGQLILFAAAFIVGYMAARHIPGPSSPVVMLINGAIVGFLSSLPVLLLIFLAEPLNLRAVFVNISPVLVRLLTFQQESMMVGVLLLILSTTVLGALGAVLWQAPPRLRQALSKATLWVLGIGLFSEILTQILRPLLNDGTRVIFQGSSLKPVAALILFVLTATLAYITSQPQNPIRTRFDALPSTQQRALRLVAAATLILLVLLLPRIVGSYLSEILVNVGLYVLMGLGLNMAVGLAGLLDLGYVATFAIGAYTMAIFTSEGQLGIFHTNFWVAVPFSILAAMFAGFCLALPILRMRGDYLAITTLGFGEIIRLLALSDWLKPYIGGAQGILGIPKASLFGFVFRQPPQIYYLVLASGLLVFFISQRLNNSRTGRQWMAMREDEDAAKAMGIDTTRSKLLAFTLSAASGGLAGALFASKLGTLFPNSFELLISINVLALIIVGGMGSMPGIVLGAFVLVGMPELLREFSEYRQLAYGILLIFMMLARPEGLLPSAVRQRELHHAHEVEPIVTSPSAGD